MSDGTHIEWTDATWNPVTGCSIASPGCKHCYAMLLAGTRLASHPSRAGLTKEVNGHHVWTGEVRFNPQWLDQPLRWRRARRIFVCAHGDLFHEDVPDSWIDRVFAVMALAPQHTFQVLTKRSRRMRDYITKLEMEPHRDTVKRMVAAWPYPIKSDMLVNGPNVWLGVSAENQHWLMQRACDLVETPAAVRFLSLEPCLDDMDIEPFVLPPRLWRNGWDNNYPFAYPKHQIDWVIVGGESGPGARPMHPDWARKIRNQCADAGVAFHFKQWGEWLPASQTSADGEVCCCGSPNSPPQRIGKKRAGRLLDGVTHDGFPDA